MSALRKGWDVEFEPLCLFLRMQKLHKMYFNLAFQ